MEEKLKEALRIVCEICADVEECYPIGLIRVRRLLTEALAGLRMADDSEPPQPAA